MRIAAHSLHFYKLPYRRPVHWFNSAEDEGTFALLHLTGDNGLSGVAEAPIKPTWSGVSPRSVAAVIEDLLVPGLRDTDITDQNAVAAILARFPENHLAKMLVDNACCTLRASAKQEPLWRSLGGTQNAEVSWTVTRQSPDLMAREAAEVVEQHGFKGLKIKGGQGVETDIQALRKIRKAVGNAIDFYVDANGAYSREEAPAYVRTIAAEGALVAEDPCVLQADDFFARFQAEAPIPVLVDSPCTSVRDATQFLERGAKALSVKPGRIGITECGRVTELARSKGANVCSGMYAESALGTLISLQLSASLKRPLVTAEQSFFLIMRDQVTRDDVRVANGRVALPATADYAALVDWDKVKRYGFSV
jgi:L-alanine-DL-glutamate epimerase-like enolase superfamily enzyme